MVDFGGEGDGGRFKWVFVWKCKVDVECAALLVGKSVYNHFFTSQSSRREGAYLVWGTFGTLHGNFPFVYV